MNEQPTEKLITIPSATPLADFMHGINKAMRDVSANFINTGSIRVLPANRIEIEKHSIGFWKITLFVYYVATLYRDNTNIRTGKGLTQAAATRRAHIQYVIRNLQNLFYLIVGGFTAIQLVNVVFLRPGWVFSAINAALYTSLIFITYLKGRYIAKVSSATNKDPQ